MPRFIDADALLKRLPDMHDYYDESGDYDAAHGYSIDVIKKFPTISPDETRGVGKWDRVETEFGLRCPKCGKLLDEYVNGGEWVALSEIPNYCPNCGAKMEVSEDA